MKSVISPPAIAPSIRWYVHLPFCTTKCGYCDFYSIPLQPGAVPDLVRAIGREMELRDPLRPIESVFVGGGTPTVLPAEALRAILDPINRRVGGRDVEFTCEANPSSADELKLDLLRELGVNRVSFGAQSFNPGELRVLERIHDPAHIPEAVRLARRAGFDNINLDLIFGVPGQTIESWLNSLRRAIELGPEHVACYGLTYEDGTKMTRQLRRGRIRACDEEIEAEMFERTVEVLGGAGYEQYEISNFARPGRRCRHNLGYWRNEEYLGLGPSAVSYIDGLRRKNVADIGVYVRAMLQTGGGGNHEQLVVESERLDDVGRARETAVQMLRLTEGIDRTLFRAATGHEPEKLFGEAIRTHETRGLLTMDANSIRLTRAGFLLANQVMADFV